MKQKFEFYQSYVTMPLLLFFVSIYFMFFLWHTAQWLENIILSLEVSEKFQFLFSGYTLDLRHYIYLFILLIKPIDSFYEIIVPLLKSQVS